MCLNFRLQKLKFLKATPHCATTVMMSNSYHFKEDLSGYTETHNLLFNLYHYPHFLFSPSY